MTTIKEPLSSLKTEVEHALCIQVSKGVGLVLAARFRNEMMLTLFADSIISCSQNMILLIMLPVWHFLGILGCSALCNKGK